MVDIQSATVKTRQGKKRKKKEEEEKPQDENIMACPITQCGHEKLRNIFAKLVIFKRS